DLETTAAQVFGEDGSAFGDPEVGEAGNEGAAANGGHGRWGSLEQKQRRKTCVFLSRPDDGTNRTIDGA
ncbi:MAG: hypothetical protein EBU76_07240, partial [Gammaproteobacteria bacterium]|nr:hypothetical protein [Gammaproteobacteria bacterium]